MIISLTTSFPTFSFRALISPSLTIIISFLTTAEVKETKSLPSITRTLFVREAIICPCKYNIKSQMRPENQEISPPVTVNNL